MKMKDKLCAPSEDAVSAVFRRFVIVVILSIAFAYIEAVCVIYIRTIFHPDGFNFPLVEFGVGDLWKKFLLIEVGREVSTLVLIFTCSFLAGRNRLQRIAFFLTIFAIWDIFYYIWLRILFNWPVSIMDWDVLFLIPITWASPVLYPLLVSLAMLLFAIAILYRDYSRRSLKVTRLELAGFIFAGVLVVVSFCIAGVNITKTDFQTYFYRPLFAAGFLSAVGLFLWCLLKSK